MKLILEIDLDKRRHQKPGSEVVRVLRHYADEIDGCGLSQLKRRLYLDGETVGEAKVTNEILH